MTRLQIKIPDTVPKTVLHIPVRITDINYGNHLGNDSVVAIIQEARVQFLQENGFTELNAGGAGLIMSDLALNFHHESFYGDELTIDIYIADVSRVSFNILYEITTKRDGKNILVATAQTTMVCFDYKTRKVASVPDVLKAILE